MILQGDCVERMRELEEASIDAIVCDPPYGLEFMGKEWDRLGEVGRMTHQGMKPGGIAAAGVVNFNASSNVRCRKCNRWKWGHKPGDGGGGGLACQCDTPAFPNPRPAQARLMQKWHQAWATEALRVLKPGGHLLAFGGTRTYHRLACAIEDAGFEIRDSLIWLYGSGFPKSLDVSKAIDKRPGVGRHAEFAAHLVSRREAKGLSRADVSEFVVGSRSGACWNWEHHQFPEAKWWPKLKELLDLNGAWGIVIAEAEREKVGEITHARSGGEDWAKRPGSKASPRTVDDTISKTPEAQKWNGWGTALKPGHEPIVVARKPLIGTVAQNVTEHGTGALNIDATRISSGQRPKMEGWENDANLCALCAKGAAEKLKPSTPETAASTAPSPAELTMNGKGETLLGATNRMATGCSAGPNLEEPGEILSDDGSSSIDGSGKGPTDQSRTDSSSTTSTETGKTTESRTCSLCGVAITLDTTSEAAKGRWPSNVLLSQEAAAELDEQSGEIGVSRFFYCAKASRGERNAGLDGFEERAKSVHVPQSDGRELTQTPLDGQHATLPTRNPHPTVKPIDLMRWLVRLVTPPGGTVLDPFAGSGTTGVAAVLEGFDFLGIEREAEYAEIARARIEWWSQFPGEDTDEVLIRAGFSERLEREHREAGQMGLL